MSREQWGHGYHKGVEDAKSQAVMSLEGWTRKEIELIMEYCIASMYYRRYELIGYYKDLDMSVFPVKWYYADYATCEKIPVPILDIIYNYIWKYRPYNTQITGPAGTQDIDNDEIRLYGYLPEGVESYEQWDYIMQEKMKPIFEKIENIWWEQAGIKS